MQRVLILHGPNLNLLGSRRPDIYGSQTLSEINDQLTKIADKHGVQLKMHQSNSEGTLIDLLHEHRTWADGIIFNPGAYTHYSIALRDAIEAIDRPTVEVHLSDIRSREPFRCQSVIAPVCIKQISGRGLQSYTDGFQYLLDHLLAGA